jgi:hypothetical protein
VPVFEGKNGKNDVQKRVFTQIFVFLLMAGLTALALRPLGSFLHSRTSFIREKIVGEAETALGLKLSYSSMRPGIFGVFEVRNIRVFDDDSVQLASLDRLRVSYSLWNLIRKNDRAIRSVLIDRPCINLDLAKRYNFAFFQGRRDEAGVPPPLDIQHLLIKYLPEKAVLRIRGGQCLMQNRRDQYSVTGIHSDIRVVQKQVSFNARCTAGLSLAGVLPFTGRLNVRLKGDYLSDSEEGGVLVNIPFISGNSFKVKPLSFKLGLQKESLVLENSSGSLPCGFSFVYDSAAGNLSSSFSCEGLTLGSFLVFNRKPRQASSWLSMASSGRAEFERDYLGKARYSVGFEGASPLGKAAFSLHLNGDEQELEIQKFRLYASHADTPEFFEGEIGLGGVVAIDPFAPNVTLSLKNFGLSGNERLNGDFDIETKENEFFIFCDTLQVGDVSLSALDAMFNPSGKGIAYMVSVFRFRNAETYGEARLGSISLDGVLDYEPSQLSAALRLDSFSVGDLIGMARPFVKGGRLPKMLQNLSRNILITTEVFLETDFRHVLYNVPRMVLAMESASKGQTLSSLLDAPFTGNAVGLISISGTDQRFELSEGNFVSNGNLLSFSAYANHSSFSDISFSLMANYRDFSYYMEGVALDLRSLTIQGSYGLGLYLGSGGNGSFSGYIQVQGIPIPYPDQIGHLSFFCSLRYTSPELWSFDIERFELLDITGSSGTINLRLAGGANQEGMSIYQISYSDGKGALSGRADVSWPAGFFGGNRAEAPSFSGVFSMGSGTERYNALASYSNDLLDVSFSGSRMQLGRFAGGAYNPVADGEISISWDRSKPITRDSFQVELKLNSFEARIQDSDLNVSAQALMDAENFTVENLMFSFAELKGGIPSVNINLAEGRAEAEAGLKGYAAGHFVDGLFSLNALFKPLESWLEIGDAFGSFSGTFRAKEFQFAEMQEADSFDVNFSRSDGALSVWGGPRNMLRLNTDQTGSFFASLSAPSPVRGSVIGKIDKNVIDAHCGDLYIDIAHLWEFVPPMHDFALGGGYFTAQIDVRGPLADPDFFGVIQANSVRILVPTFIPRDIRPVPFSASISGNEIRFDKVPTAVGSGGGTVSAWFRFDRWIPSDWSLDIFVPPQTPIPFSFDLTGFLASGETSGRLTISMNSIALEYSGDLYANNTEMWLNTDELDSAEGRDIFGIGRVPVNADINVNAGPTVEFFWPNRMFPILRVNPDIGTLVKIKLDTQARLLSVDSDVKFRRGEVFYFERSFYIRSGNLLFRENEFGINPLLTVRAEARDRNDAGPVSIYLIVDNAPLLSFAARFESSPSLSQAEIFSLLGQNLAGAQGDENTGGAQRAIFNSGVDIVAQLFVVRWAEQQILRILPLDMLSFRTQALQNAFFDVTGFNQTPVDRISGYGNYLDNTTVFLGKYFGANIFGQSMVALRYDENRTSRGGLRFELDFGVEMQTPLFNVRFNWLPVHPENWYVSDSAITLTYSKTF